MEIKGCAHLLFEQSGTFKKEFQKLGIDAFDYDIQNNFGETDHVVDIFKEIEHGYDGMESIFDKMCSDDIVISFFPCIHFCGISQTMFSITTKNYRNLTNKEKFEKILKKNRDRSYFFELLNKLVCICIEKNLRLVIENPMSGQSFLRVFLKQPDIIDHNRMERGDYMIKPTAYWFFNCEPTHGFTHQNDKKQLRPTDLKPSGQAGLCSEDRSMISPDYARNWICDFILGKEQPDIDTESSIYKLF